MKIAYLGRWNIIAIWFTNYQVFYHNFGLVNYRVTCDLSLSLSVKQISRMLLLK